MDQPGQCCAHRLVQIGIGEAAVQLQPRNDSLKEDAALLDRHAGGGGPDGPKLRIGEGELVTMVWPTRRVSTVIPMRRKHEGWPAHGRCRALEMVAHAFNRMRPVPPDTGSRIANPRPLLLTLC